MNSDLEIARQTALKPITEIATQLGIPIDLNAKGIPWGSILAPYIGNGCLT